MVSGPFLPLKLRTPYDDVTIDFHFRLVARCMILTDLPPWLINTIICVLTAATTQVCKTHVLILTEKCLMTSSQCALVRILENLI